jgi:Flp pilus assembly protein TadB
VSHRGPYIAAGIVVAIIALFLLPTWIAWAVVAAVIGLPVVAYFTLDRSQRRRIHRIRRREIR